MKFSIFWIYFTFYLLTFTSISCKVAKTNLPKNLLNSDQYEQESRSKAQLGLTHSKLIDNIFKGAGGSSEELEKFLSAAETRKALAEDFGKNREKWNALFDELADVEIISKESSKILKKKHWRFRLV